MIFGKPSSCFFSHLFQTKIPAMNRIRTKGIRASITLKISKIIEASNMNMIQSTLLSQVYNSAQNLLRTRIFVGMPQHGLLIPSFSQVIHGFTPINPNSGTSTPGSRSTPTNSKRGGIKHTFLAIIKEYLYIVQSNSGKKYSNSPRVFNKQINEDINLIERIEGLLTTIADNYNRYCPVCQGCKALR